MLITMSLFFFFFFFLSAEEGPWTKTLPLVAGPLLVFNDAHRKAREPGKIHHVRVIEGGRNWHFTCMHIDAWTFTGRSMMER